MVRRKVSLNTFTPICVVTTHAQKRPCPLGGLYASLILTGLSCRALIVYFAYIISSHLLTSTKQTPAQKIAKILHFNSQILVHLLGQAVPLTTKRWGLLFIKILAYAELFFLTRLGIKK